MSPLPPPDSHTPSLPPPRPPEPMTARPTPVSRRALLLGAGGLVITTGGVAAWLASGSGRSGSPSSAPASSAPASAVPTATMPVPDPSVAAPTTAPTVASVPTAATPSTDRVLVVVQLSGGNDALNTLVPVVGSYHDARPSIGLADESLLAVPGDTALGLHPALAPLAPYLDDGRLGVVAGVGFEQPDRSHFAALDMWWSAAPGETFRSGWLGRWLDQAAGAAFDPAALLPAIGLGGAVPALRAERVQAIGVGEIDRFVLPAGDPALVDAWAGLGGAHTAARLATDVFAELAAAASATTTAAGSPTSSPGDGDRVTDRLAVAAELIVTRPDVRVVHVTMGSFDTHSNQLDTHAGLLGELADGLAAFQRRIDEAGLADRVLVITTSEFGRRVAENGSGGTDHGKAGVLFVLGGAVRTEGTAVFGSIDPGDLVEGDLRPVVDPRSAYASALDWLSIDATGAIADTVVGTGFERLPFLTP